ncbi:hypothetical protein EVAR_55668_1 [Eumeta japonica]|uniref:Uncharacterized protein n=1 Tax=Eumeta variegata TaxID=151549 RepID=A0A4C1ZYZ5_EUMVA|nr:hypothetical protein EVAR_55668_1 [Eumeta japonica]
MALSSNRASSKIDGRRHVRLFKMNHWSKIGSVCNAAKACLSDSVSKRSIALWSKPPIAHSCVIMNAHSTISRVLMFTRECTSPCGYEMTSPTHTPLRDFDPGRPWAREVRTRTHYEIFHDAPHALAMCRAELLISAAHPGDGEGRSVHPHAACGERNALCPARAQAQAACQPASDRSLSRRFISGPSHASARFVLDFTQRRARGPARVSSFSGVVGGLPARWPRGVTRRHAAARPLSLFVTSPADDRYVTEAPEVRPVPVRAAASLFCVARRLFWLRPGRRWGGSTAFCQVCAIDCKIPMASYRLLNIACFIYRNS